MSADKVWSPLEALKEASLALPDAEDQSLLKSLGISQGVMNRIQDAIDLARTRPSRADDDVFAALEEARGALDKAWVQAAEASGKQVISIELLNGIDAAIHRGHMDYVADVAGREVAKLEFQNNLATQCKEILAAAKDMGLAHVDAGKLTDLLETGYGPYSGMFVGKIAGVDAEKGLVFQASGRGDGVVLPLDKLSRPVEVGEMATITFKDGRGTVADRGQAQAQDRGR